MSCQFLPAIQSIKKPVLLIFDGHYSHVSTRIIKLAMAKDILLECLPPHTTTILQLLDVVTLTKVKTAWRRLLHEHNFNTNGSPIDKVKFAYLVSCLSNLSEYNCFYNLVWENSILKSHCQGGFAKSGIYPFDPRAVYKEKLLSPSSSTVTDENQEPLLTIRSDSDDVIIQFNPSENSKRSIIRTSSCINLSTTCKQLNNDNH